MSRRAGWFETGSLALVVVMAAVAGEPDYLSPAAIAADPARRTLYIAEQTGNQIAVFDLDKGSVVRRWSLPDPPGGLCLAPDASRVYVTGATANGRVYVVDPGAGQITGAIAVGHTPGAPVVSPGGDTLYVPNQFSNSVSVVDLTLGRQTGIIPVLREPAAAALTPDGRWLLVANLLPTGPADIDYVAARVSLIDTGSQRVVKQIALPNGSTVVRGLSVSPDGRYAYAVHIQAHFQLVTIQLDRGWMNTNALSVIDVGAQSLLQTVVLDEKTLGAANPWDVACTEDGRYLVVSHAGTHELSVIDREALHERLRGRAAPAAVLESRSSFQTGLAPPDFRLLRDIRRRVKLAGAGPRGLAVIGRTAYAAEYFSDSVGAVEVGLEASEARSLPLGRRSEETIERRGEFLFHDATRSYQQWQSCATCHPERARVDGLNWDLMNDGVGNPKSTKSLLLAHQTPPAMVSGVRERAEVAVRAGFKVILFSPRPEAEAAAVDAYLKSLEPVPSPYLVNGRLSPAAERGKSLFQQAGCAACHPPPLYTDLKEHDVGTGRGNEAGRPFDTPTLVEAWRTGPYLYDGRAVSMRDVLAVHNSGDKHGVTSKLTEQQIQDLVEFVLSL